MEPAFRQCLNAALCGSALRDFKHRAKMDNARVFCWQPRTHSEPGQFRDKALVASSFLWRVNVACFGHSRTPLCDGRSLDGQMKKRLGLHPLLLPQDNPVVFFQPAVKIRFGAA